MAASQSVKITRVTRTRRCKGKKPTEEKQTKITAFNPKDHPRGPDGRFVRA